MARIAELEQIAKEKNELEVRIVELERSARENIELRSRVAKLEQKLSQNDSRSKDAEQVDTFIPKEQSSANISGTANASRRTNSDDTPKQSEINSDNISDNTSNPDVCHESSSQYPASPIRKENKSLEDKAVDEFLGSTYKEKVSKEIIQRIREKKLREQEFSSISVEELCSKLVPLEQNSKSVPIQPEETKVSHDYIVTHPSRNQAQSIISSEINIMTEHQPCDPGSHPHVTETKNDSIQKDSRIEMQKFIQELYLEPVSEESIEVIKNKEPDISDHNENDKHIVIELAHLYQKARKAKKNTIYAKQEEILSWYYYAEGFERRVNDNLSICRNNKRADDLARIQVYDEIWDCLSGVSRENFRKQTQRAYKIYKLFNGLGKDKIKRVKSYSANGISKLSNSQIQYIIEHFTKESRNSKDTFTSNKVECVPCDLGSHPYVTKSSNSNDLAESEVSASSISPSNPTRDHVYFRNKILKQYPNLCQEGSDGNDDYYGITDKSLCPLCNLDHDDENGIEGRYGIGSYNLKCEQRGIEIEVTA
ncbi:hypothetical protein C2G38_677561 [Gigaspora rosea]|uniref:Uncharacterized protein n=1 Tax=Gigaspora rosea TaxID=44941 RepID=A0A397U6U8_9GLOM|nr:hypothetical protein C2G38_677561 [Gigaspora rosea]